MWAADPPRASAVDAARACASGMRDRAIAQRLLDAESELEANSAALQTAALGHSLETVTEANYVVSGMSNAELKTIYLGQLGRANRPASRIRNELIGSGPYGLCCYCFSGQATTLDHFVPKEHVAALAIEPWNLVPACLRCNHKLLSYLGESPDDQLLHPYAMPSVRRWLRAVVVPGAPVSVAFYASPDPALGPSLGNRILNQFARLELGRFFSIISGPDISETDAVLAAQFEPGNAAMVQAHLLEAAVGAFAADPNHRRGALFEALAGDHTYCDGGYLTTAPLAEAV
jgi:5-methylcytosine-specific restriction endonuclease McrA